MVKVVFTRPDFNVGQSPLEGSWMVWVDPKWPKLSGFYVVTTLETILGCILTDFSWTTPLDFLDIMLGLPERSQLCSVIIEVRTLIFGQNDLCPYVGRGFDCPEYLKKLHFDRFFMDHPISHFHSAQISMLVRTLWKGPGWFWWTPNGPNSAHFML